MKKIIVAGSVVLDIIMTIDPAVKRGIETLFMQGKTTNIDGVAMYLGGVIGNTGLALHKMGLPVCLICKVGNDRIGKIVLEIINEFGTDNKLTIVDDCTSSAAVAITPPGMDKMSFFHIGAAQTFDVDDAPADELAAADLFHFGYPPAMKKLYANNGEGLEKLFAKAQKAGATTSVDMTMIDLKSEAGKQDWNTILNRMLLHTDIYLPSIEETLFLMDRKRYLELASRAGSKNLIDELDIQEITSLADQLLSMGPAIIMIKMGKKGLYLRTADENRLKSAGRAAPENLTVWAGRELWCEAVDTNPIISSTGAGDTAIAGFLAAYLNGAGPVEALEMASVAASICISSPDTVSKIDHYSSMKEILEHPVDWLNAGLDQAYWTRFQSGGIHLGKRDKV